MGTIYKPKYTDKKTGEVKQSAVYWIQYYFKGKSYRESSKSTSYDDAKTLLRLREGETGKGHRPSINIEKIQFSELLDDYLEDYRRKELKTIGKAEMIAKELKEAFRLCVVPQVSETRINAYLSSLKDRDLANATINRRISALKRIFKIASRHRPHPKVNPNMIPVIDKLPEDNVRTGFFEEPEFQSLHKHLPDYLKGFATFAYRTGWRSTEITGLKWDQVDLDSRTVRLWAGTTKNKAGRLVYLDDELLEVVSRQRQSTTLSPYVFPGIDGKVRMVDFRGSWNKACRDAGLGYGYRMNTAYVSKWEGKLPSGPILHDFRRSAARNLVRSGVNQNIAMQVTGHKTHSVFDRYNIVDEEDMKAAALMQQAYLDRMRNITDKVTVKVKPFPEKKEKVA